MNKIDKTHTMEQLCVTFKMKKVIYNNRTPGS